MPDPSKFLSSGNPYSHRARKDPEGFNVDRLSKSEKSYRQEDVTRFLQDPTIRTLIQGAKVNISEIMKDQDISTEDYLKSLLTLPQIKEALDLLALDTEKERVEFLLDALKQV